MALETLPIIVHFLMPAWAAILFSTIVVLIAAEIVPQALCTGPKKIAIAGKASPIILIMIKILWILAYPMAKGLDYLLGAHTHHRIQHKDFANFLTGGSQTLKSTEKLILTSILELRTKRVPQIMIPLANLYMLELNEKLTPSKIK
jgi:metal transporter CNNM